MKPDYVQKLADAFASLDNARVQAADELVKAANRAFGADVFQYANFIRDGKGVNIRLNARIPVGNDSEFWDEG